MAYPGLPALHSPTRIGPEQLNGLVDYRYSIELRLLTTFLACQGPALLHTAGRDTGVFEQKSFLMSMMSMKRLVLCAAIDAYT